MGHGVEMGGCGKCVRIFMFVSNFIIWIGSIVILAIGIWTVVDKPYLENLLGGTLYLTAAYIFIASGCVAFFVSFLGCFGALKEIKCMLLLYFIIVLILFLVLLVGGILAYVFRGKAENTINNAMMQSLKEFGEADKVPITKGWDDTQTALECCGIKEQDDWVKYNKLFSTSTNRVPSSCCKFEDDKRISCERSPNEDNSFTVGCYGRTREIVDANSLVIGGVGVAIAFLMLLGLIFSLLLFKLIK